MPNSFNTNAFKGSNISLWEDTDFDKAQTIARLDRLNAGRLQRLRTEDLLFYQGELALKLSGLQDKDPHTDRSCLKYGAKDNRPADTKSSSGVPRACPKCCLHLPTRLARVILNEGSLTYEASSRFLAEYGKQFHVIREGPYLRWKEKDNGCEKQVGDRDRAVFEAGRNVAIVTMLSWFL